MLWILISTQYTGMCKIDSLHVCPVFSAFWLVDIKHVFQEIEENSKDDNCDEKEKDIWWGKATKGLRRSQGTLVVCPASLIGHWEKEAKDRFKTDTFKILVYHGNNRGQSAKK